MEVAAAVCTEQDCWHLLCCGMVAVVADTAVEAEKVG